MNRIYKLIWSKTRNCYVAVSEIAKRQSKSGNHLAGSVVRGALVSAIFLSLTAGVSSPVWAGVRAWDNYDQAENRMKGYIDYIDGQTIAIGSWGISGNNANTVAIGFNGGTTGPNAVSVGIGASAGQYASAFGNNARANGGGSSAYGASSSASGFGSSAYGASSVASGGDSAAFGDSSNASGDHGSAYGASSSASGYYGSAFGASATASGYNSAAFGANSQATSDSTSAFGVNAKAYGSNGVAVGRSTFTGWGANNTAVGQYTNIGWGGNNAALGSGNLVAGDRNTVIGSGSSAGAANGYLIPDQNQYPSSYRQSYDGIAVGTNARVDGYSNIAMGNNAQVNVYDWAANYDTKLPASNSIAIGSFARAEAMDTTTIGRQSQALMRNATAYGNNSHANSNNSIAIGNKAIAGQYTHIFNTDGSIKETSTDEDGFTYGAGADDSAVAIGNRATAINSYTTAIGVSSFASGTHSVSVGDSNRATGAFSTALGAGASYYHIEYKDPATGEVIPDEPGNPNSENERNVYDAMEANQAAGDFSTAVGYVNRTVGENSTGVGKFNDVTGKDSLAVGSGNKVGTVKAEKGSEGDALVEKTQDNLVTGYAVGSENEIAGKNEGAYDGAYGHKNKVSGDNSYAMGNENTVDEAATKALAIGNNNTVYGKETIAIGTENTVTGEQSIAVGYGHTINGNRSGAFGDPDDVDADGSYVVGNDSKVEDGSDESFVMGNKSTASAKRSMIFGNESKVSGEGGIVAGSKSEVSAKNSVAIGNNAKATMENSVALGSGSETTHMGGLDGKKEIEIPGTNTKYTNVKGESPVGTVSVGKPGEERTITNVAAGRIGPDSTDAVNGSELYAVEQKVAANTQDIVNLNNKYDDLDTRINKIGAGAAALAGLHPLDFDPDEKWDFAASLGSYRDEQAVALGAFYRPNEDTMFSIAGTVADGRNMINVGVSWKFGQKNRISANRISSAKEIIELRKNQENVHSFLADAVAGNQLDLSKIQLFPDVEENHWAYDYVATMAGNGVLEGYPDGYFKGNRNMTRYEMAAVLYRLMQNGARLSDKALTEFAPELDRIRVDTITHHKDGTPHIQRVRTIKERVEEKPDPAYKEEKLAQEKAAKEKIAKEKAEAKAAKEQLAKEKAEEKAAKEKLAQEKKAQEKAAKEQLAKEKAEEKAAKEKLAQEKKAQEKAAKEQAAKEKAAAKAAKAKAAEKPAEK